MGSSNLIGRGGMNERDSIETRFGCVVAAHGFSARRPTAFPVAARHPPSNLYLPPSLPPLRDLTHPPPILMHEALASASASPSQHTVFTIEHRGTHCEG